MTHAHASKGFGSPTVAFLIGIGAGAAAGLLLAPRSGQETRTKLKEKAAETRTKMEQQAAQRKEAVTDAARQAVTKVADKTEETLEAGRSAAEDMQHKTRRTSNKLAGEE